MNENSQPDEIVNGPDPRRPKRVNQRAGVIGLLAVAGVTAGGAALYVANAAGAAPAASNSSASANNSASTAGTPSASSSATCGMPRPGAWPGPGTGRWSGGPGFGRAGRGPFGAGAGGRITAVSSTSLTVRDLFGKSHTYKITSSTVVHSGSAGAARVSDLTVGENVAVRTSSSSSTATEIDVRLAGIDGSVSSVTSTAITVTDRDGFTRTIDTDAATKYTLNSSSSATRSKVKSGSVVHAEGKVDANGTALDAATVDVITSVKRAGTGGSANACAPGRGHRPGGPGHRADRGAPTPRSTVSGTTVAPAKPTPSATTTR